MTITLSQDLNEDLHGADENRGQGLDLLQTTDEDIAMHLMGQLPLTSIHLARYFGKARTQVLDELDQIFHAFDDFGHSQIIEDLLALADDFADLRFIEAEQKIRSSLKDSARPFNQFFPVGRKKWNDFRLQIATSGFIHSIKRLIEAIQYLAGPE